MEFDPISSENVYFGDSATEYELRYAIRLDAERYAWFRRSFDFPIVADQDIKGLFFLIFVTMKPRGLGINSSLRLRLQAFPLTFFM
jgi:hypothetical protein